MARDMAASEIGNGISSKQRRFTAGTIAMC
jgi:hypothetical protein